VDFLKNHVEALVFCSPDPISEEDIKTCLVEMFDAKVPKKDIEKALAEISQKFESEEFSFQLLKSGGGYQFLTKPQYQSSISILLKQKSKKRLSNSSLETLSIIAYKQPITKVTAEQIRGVGCDYSLQKLLEKELIQIMGKAETVGKPILYGTSQKFLDYFGINSIEELPTLKDFQKEQNEITPEEGAIEQED
jgi:segregation and condensation protein B